MGMVQQHGAQAELPRGDGAPSVRIRLFAAMAAHGAAVELPLEGPRTLGEIVKQFRSQRPEIPWPAGVRVVCNMEFVPEDHVVEPGDELACIPPVSGG